MALTRETAAAWLRAYVRALRGRRTSPEGVFGVKLQSDQLDAADLRDRLREAEQALASAGDDSERGRVAEADKKRLEAFLAIAESGS